MSRRRSVRALVILPTEAVFDELPEKALSLEDYGLTVKDVVNRVVELWAILNSCAYPLYSRVSDHQANVLREMGEIAAIQSMVEEELVSPTFDDYLHSDEVDVLVILLVEIATLFYLEIDKFMSSFLNIGTIDEVSVYGWLRHDLILKVVRHVQ